MQKIILLALVAFTAVGCSHGKIVEAYDGGSGVLTERRYTSWQLGTTRQATMVAKQQDESSLYDLAVGETVQVDPELARAINVLSDHGFGLAGLSQLRRAGAIAPISLDQFGSVRAQPINEAQGGVLVDRRELEKLTAENAALKAELEAAHAPEVE